MLRAVKYCGGCNPRYDRAALVRRLENKLGELLLYLEPDKMYDEIYVVCGCSARCADISALKAKKIIFICDSNLSL